jgi:outer membrane protein
MRNKMKCTALILFTTALAAAVFAADAPRVLTLDEALRTAREHQPQLRQARAVTAAAMERARETRAPLLPQVTGSANYSRSTANFSSRPGSVPGSISGTSGSSWNTFNYYNFGINANQLVYDFGQVRSRWRAAQANAEADRSSEQTTLQAVLTTVRTTYFQARAAKGLVTVARDTLANQEKHLQQVEAFVEVGTRPEIDLAQSRTDVANARVQLINAENGYDIARAQLNQAMGVEGPIDYDVADETLPPVEGEDAPTDVLLGEALKARPEIASLKEEIHAQELTLRSIRGAYAPSLSVSTGFTDAGQQLNNLAWNWNASLNVSIPVFLGLLTEAQVGEAKWNLENLKAQADLLRQQVRFDVEQTRLGVRAAVAALSAAGEALVNAQERLKLAEGRYEAGVGNIIELGDAQVALTSAGEQEVTAEYQLSTARAQLLRALGRT